MGSCETSRCGLWSRWCGFIENFRYVAVVMKYAIKEHLLDVLQMRHHQRLFSLIVDEALVYLFRKRVVSVCVHGGRYQEDRKKYVR